MPPYPRDNARRSSSSGIAAHQHQQDAPGLKRHRSGDPPSKLGPAASAGPPPPRRGGRRDEPSRATKTTVVPATSKAPSSLSSPPAITKGPSSSPLITPTTPVGRLLNELPPTIVPLEKCIRSILYVLTDITCPNGPPSDGRTLTAWDTPPVVRQVVSRAKVITDVFCVLADRTESLCEVYGSGRTGLVSAYSSDVDCVVRELSQKELVELEMLGAKETPRHIRAQQQPGGGENSNNKNNKHNKEQSSGGDINDYGIKRLSTDAEYLQKFIHITKQLADGSRVQMAVKNGVPFPEASPVFLTGAPSSCAIPISGAQEEASALRKSAWRQRGISNLFGLSPFATEGPLHDVPQQAGDGEDAEGWGPRGNDDSDDEDSSFEGPIDLLSSMEGDETAPTTASSSSSDGSSGDEEDEGSDEEDSKKKKPIPIHRQVGMSMSVTVKESIIAAPLIPVGLASHHSGGFNKTRQKDEILQLTRITRNLKPTDVPSTWMVAFTQHASTFTGGKDVTTTTATSSPRISFTIVNPMKKRIQPRNLRNAFSNTQTILHARVPIAKMVHAAEGIPVDLGFCRDGASTSDYIIKKIATADSVWNDISKLTRELMFVNSCLDAEYLRKPSSDRANRIEMIQSHRDNIDSQLEQLATHSNLLLSAARGLVIILKHLLHSHGLNDPSMGGLGSFPLTLMVLWFLEEVAPSLPKNLQGSYAVLLVKFLGYFGDVTGKGEGFNARRYGICIATRTMFQKPPTDELMIKNPLDGSQNAAKACQRFFTSVQPLFHKWFKMLFPTATASTAAASPTSPSSASSVNQLEVQMQRSLSPMLQPLSPMGVVDHNGRPFPLLDGSRVGPPPPPTVAANLQQLPKSVQEIERLFADIIKSGAAAPPPSEFSSSSSSPSSSSHHHHHHGGGGGVAVYHAVLRRLGECAAADKAHKEDLARLPSPVGQTEIPLNPYEALAPTTFDWLPYSQVFVMSGIGGLWL